MAPARSTRTFIQLAGMVLLAGTVLLNLWHPERADSSLYDPSTLDLIVSLRLPRVLVGLIVGACLGASGSLCQGLFKNPLASPDILGCGVVAHLATLLVIWFLPYDVIYWAVPLAACAGAGVALLACLMVWRKFQRSPIELLLLIGIALSAFAGSMSSLFFSFAHEVPAKAMQMMNFSFGSLDARDWNHVLYLLPGIIALAFCPYLLRRIELTNLGDDVAMSLGVKVRAMQTGIIVVMSVLLGCSIAAAGPIAFVALVIPQAVRLAYGSNYQTTFFGSLLWGAIVVLAADFIGASVVFPKQIDVGICTALIGAPGFAWLLVHQYRKGLP